MQSRRCFIRRAGNRSVGGSAHALNFDASAGEYYAKANDELLVVLQCEHIQAVRDAESIFSTPGIDAIFVGPNDLAASMRTPDGKPPAADAMSEALKHILATCKKCKVAPGIHTGSPEEARMRIEEGWQFIADHQRIEDDARWSEQSAGGTRRRSRQRRHGPLLRIRSRGAGRVFEARRLSCRRASKTRPALRSLNKNGAA